MARASERKEILKNKPGRATTYTQSIGDEICERLADGEPLRVICRDEHMPAWRTVYHWIEANEDFAARIARGRVMGREAIFEDTLIIADTPVDGVKREISENGVKEVHEDMLGHRKLQIETRLKLLAKWDPKKYGERLHSEITGANGGPIETKSDVSLSPDEAYMRMLNAGA